MFRPRIHKNGQNKIPILFYTILYYTILYYIILYYTILCFGPNYLSRHGQFVRCLFAQPSQVDNVFPSIGVPTEAGSGRVQQARKASDSDATMPSEKNVSNPLEQPERRRSTFSAKRRMFVKGLLIVARTYLVNGMHSPRKSIVFV